MKLEQNHFILKQFVDKTTSQKTIEENSKGLKLCLAVAKVKQFTRPWHMKLRLVKFHGEKDTGTLIAKSFTVKFWFILPPTAGKISSWKILAWMLSGQKLPYENQSE